jgi:hypothetical protein
MKPFSLLIALSFLLFFSCSKKDDNIQEDPKVYISNNNAKSWKLTKIFVNGSLQNLTVAQLLFTKTYKSDNTWQDSDGYSGTYSIVNPQLFKEITINASGGNTTIDYKINSLNQLTLDIEYTFNQQTYRFVYGQ